MEFLHADTCEQRIHGASKPFGNHGSVKGSIWGASEFQKILLRHVESELA